MAGGGGDARAAAFGAEAPLLRELQEGAAVVRAYGRVGAAAEEELDGGLLSMC